MNLEARFIEGIRRHANGDLNAAITAFLDAKGSTELRVAALNYLGQCFLQKRWHAEAIDAWRQALQLHDRPEDALGLEMRARLAVALSERNKTIR